MLTSNVPADPSCSTGLLEPADHLEAELESGWTDCFTWEKLLCTGKDLPESSQISTARVSTVTHSQTPLTLYELNAADFLLAREARQCLIADHTTSGSAAASGGGLLQARQAHAAEHHQLTKARVLQSSCRPAEIGFAADNNPYVGGSSLVSDASSGPSTSSCCFPFMGSAQFLGNKNGADHDVAHHLLDIVERRRVTSCSKRMGATFLDIDVEKTCRKTRRTAMPLNLHASSSFSAASAATISEPHECSAATSRICN